MDPLDTTAPFEEDMIDHMREVQPGRALWKEHIEYKKFEESLCAHNVALIQRLNASEISPGEKHQEKRSQIPSVTGIEISPESQEGIRRRELEDIYVAITKLENRIIKGYRPQTIVQWRAALKLHKGFHSDCRLFILRSQHRSATPALQKLLLNYAIPARVWRYGVQYFLKLACNCLPDSLDYMLSMIDSAYGLMTGLYQTIPKFNKIWIKCLIDLERYRIAIIRREDVWNHLVLQNLADTEPQLVRTVELVLDSDEISEELVTFAINPLGPPTRGCCSVFN